MAGVRSNDQKGRLVPYTQASNGAPGGNGGSNIPYTAYDATKPNGLASYKGNNNSSSTGTGSGNFPNSKVNNHTSDGGNYGASAPGNDFGAGSGNFGGTTRGAADDFWNQPQSVPKASQGYPVINHGGGSGAPGGPAGYGGGTYVATPVPVSNSHGSAPTGPQQNGGFTTNGPANTQLEGSGKTFGSGGAGGYGPVSPHGYGGQNGSLSGSEKHHHHHYYYSNNHQHHPVPYNNNSVLPEESKRKRRSGAGALAAALIACWACTCCCHVPCGC